MINMPTNKPTIINGDLILKQDTTYDSDLIVNGNILEKNGEKHNLTVKGNISAWNISANDISAWNISVQWNISAANISAQNILTGNISAWNISAGHISYYAVCFAYKDIKCKSIHGRRKNSRHFVLDGKITIED